MIKDGVLFCHVFVFADDCLRRDSIVASARGTVTTNKRVSPRGGRQEAAVLRASDALACRFILGLLQELVKEMVESDIQLMKTNPRA